MQLKPSEILFSQDSINNYFDQQSLHSGHSIGQTLDDICEGRCSVSDIPTITVVEENGKWTTADNRRLWVFRELERLGKCSTIPVREGYYIPEAKKTSYNGGKTINVRRNAGGRWHLKPSVRKATPERQSFSENSTTPSVKPSTYYDPFKSRPALSSIGNYNTSRIQPIESRALPHSFRNVGDSSHSNPTFANEPSRYGLQRTGQSTATSSFGYMNSRPYISGASPITSGTHNQIMTANYSRNDTGLRHTPSPVVKDTLTTQSKQDYSRDGIMTSTGTSSATSLNRSPPSMKSYSFRSQPSYNTRRIASPSVEVDLENVEPEIQGEGRSRDSTVVDMSQPVTAHRSRKQCWCTIL